MRIFSIVGALAIALSGCATPAPNPWDDITVDSAEAVTCDALPDIPIPELVGDRFVYTREQVNQLDAYFILAEACVDISYANAKAIQAHKEAQASLLAAGQGQRALTEMQREMLRDERRHHWLEKAGLYAIILVGLGAASL